MLGTFGNKMLSLPPLVDNANRTVEERVEEIKNEEDHTSLDSVIKSLLKERENK